MCTAAFSQPRETIVSSDGSLIFGSFVAMADGYAITNKVDLTGNVALVLKQTNGQWEIVDELVGDGDANSNDPQAFLTGHMYGNRAILGDTDFSQPTAVNAGTAYFYRRDGETWVREGRVIASDFDGNDNFGQSVAIHDEVAIIGAPGSDDNGSKSGAAYIFRRNGEVWTEEAKLLPADGTESSEFGFSVAINGAYAAVGVLIDSEAGALAGAAYVFHDNGDSWVQIAKLFPSDPVQIGTFGISLDMDGDRLLVGAQGATGASTSTGAAYLFERDNDLWVQTTKLFAEEPNPGAFFGNAVSIQGDCAVVGAFNENLATGGAAYTFAYVDGRWQQVYKIQASQHANNNLFGFSVAVSGGSVFAAAQGTLTNVNNTIGAAYLYDDACSPTATSTEQPAMTDALSIVLKSNYPNPFKARTSIPFELGESEYVKIRVVDLLGREVETLAARQFVAGQHAVSFDGSGYKAGMYFVELSAASQKQVRPLIYAP